MNKEVKEAVEKLQKLTQETAELVQTRIGELEDKENLNDDAQQELDDLQNLDNSLDQVEWPS